MSTSLPSLLAAEGPNQFWLPDDINEVYWGSLAFFVVAFLLWKFARKPAASSSAAGSPPSRASSTPPRSSVLPPRPSVTASRQHSRIPTPRPPASSRKPVAAPISSAVDIAARTERRVAQMRERAAIDLAATRAQAESDLAGELSRLSLGAAERVVQTSLDDDAQQRLIDQYISQVGTQN